MTTYTLDTHAAIKELEAAGMESRQAEAVVAAISRADAQVATKQDIAGVTQDLKQDIVELRADMAARETRLVKWAVALVGLAVVAQTFLDWVMG